MPSFSDYALEKMLDLYANHGNQVGSNLKKSDPITYKDYEATDCITYVQQVLLYAYQKSGRSDFASKVQKNLAANAADGTKLAKLLVVEDSWTGAYINPDTSYWDKSKNNPGYNARNVRSSCKYYGIPLSYQVVDYAPDLLATKTPAAAAARFGVGMLSYALLSTVKFGYGCSFGGIHTWLFSYGEAYEVHWDAAPTGTLYEKRPLSKFTNTWRTGAIVVPYDAFLDSKLNSAIRLSCA